MDIRTVCHSKIHRATVTMADLNYVGSITIDQHLLTVADIFPYEQVQVVNITNGNRFITYAISGVAHSGTMCVNGAAARLVAPGDLIIVIAYKQITRQQLPNHQPRVLFVDENNVITSLQSTEIASSTDTPHMPDAVTDETELA